MTGPDARAVVASHTDREEVINMRFRKIALALFACLALGAFAANAAQAAEGEGWTIGTTENQTTVGTLIPLNVHEEITCARHKGFGEGSKLVFTSTLLAAPIEITAGQIDCTKEPGVTTRGATIDNTTSKGHSEGALTFTDVTVVKPAHCSVPNNELTTAQITDQIIMDPTAGSTVVFDRFFPEVAAKGFFTIKFEGAECTLAGNEAVVNGSFCGEAVHTNAGGTGYEPNKTGTLTKVQTLLFGEAQQKTGNSAAKPCELKFGKAALQLSGAVDNELQSGIPFGAD